MGQDHDELDELSFCRLMAEEIRTTQHILDVLASADKTPAILLAQKLYAERIARFRDLLDQCMRHELPPVDFSISDV